MHFYQLIKELTKNTPTIIFIDMDGVIVSYDFGKPLNFENIRPLLTNIKTINKLCELKNIELKILSICRTDNQINEKNNWLDKYAPFIEKDKRITL